MPRSVDDLRAMLESSDPAQRKAALTRLARHTHPELASAVARLLRDDDVDIRARAAWVLDLMQQEPTIPALVEALHDDSFDVRSNAGWALVHLGEAAVRPVIDVYQGDHDDAREMAHQVLLRIDSEEAAAALRERKPV